MYEYHSSQTPARSIWGGRPSHGVVVVGLAGAGILGLSREAPARDVYIYIYIYIYIQIFIYIYIERERYICILVLTSITVAVSNSSVG